MFTVPNSELTALLKEYRSKVPEYLNRQFPDRIKKADAVSSRKQTLKLLQAILYPNGNQVVGYASFSKF